MDKFGKAGIKAIAFSHGYAYASSLIVSAIAAAIMKQLLIDISAIAFIKVQQQL